jgi:hypothetical protein
MRATVALESTGWLPVGRGGLVRKYLRFVGVPVDRVAVVGMLEIRLGSNGVALMQGEDPAKRCPLRPPAFVAPSMHVLRYLSALVDDCNEKLMNRHHGRVAVQWRGHNQFVVCVGNSSATADQPLASFPNPLAALDWASALELDERRPPSSGKPPEPARWLRLAASRKPRGSIAAAG